ncbi:MAG: hypothetical protein Q4D20_03695 [Clostridia bacterium]|nr:hypothetical protein [Clostridia bacterium]
MKRKIIASILLFAVVLTAFSGCTKGSAANENPSSAPQSGNSFSGYIVENTGKDLLVASKDGLDFVSTESAKIQRDGKELSALDLKPGMTVKIDFDGTVLETYPGQIPNVGSITVTAEEEDKISLFKEAFIHIFETRENLGEEKTIALDFSKITSLSDEQICALEYVLENYFSSKTKANVIRGSYEELEKNGVIKDNFFPDGIILSLSEEKGNKFSVSWWKGGTCASGFSDCTAKMKNGEWVINYGDAWIS